jgi:diacylglycerol kinase (CTP)
MHSAQTETTARDSEPTTRRSARRKSHESTQVQSGPQSAHHLTPVPFLDPIRSVKRESIHWKRKVFHVIGIGAAGFTYALAPVSVLQALAILGAMAVVFVTLDALRFFVPALNKKVKRDFGPFMRDYELDGLSGSSWFFISALITIALFPKWAAALGMVYLAVGDPLASFVGVRWGRIRLPGGKSLEGSIALALLCSVVGTILLIAAGGIGPLAAVTIASVSAVTAAVAEWLPIKRVDDNFTVPLMTGAMAALLLAVVL